MISAQGLTKRYGQTEAIRDLSFTVEQGEIVGFLGRNGAGKSTTMKILSGYLPADEGEVTIAGFDILSQSLKARSRIGYLPENVPLYPEMRVGEYLSYRAALKGVRARRIAEKVEDAVELCHIGPVREKLIGALSKGYRQRVGLADALVNEPDILILDEPSIGLDPGQIREVRSLIRGLAGRHTILLSSHILSEVEATCSRVLILEKGRIAAAGTPEELRRRAGCSLTGTIRMEIAGGNSPSSVLEALASLPGVASAELVGETTSPGWWAFDIVPATEDPREEFFVESVRRGWRLRELSSRGPTLEEIFASFTGSQTEGKRP